MEENHHLLRPLLISSTTTSSVDPPLGDEVTNNLNIVSSNLSIIFRIAFVTLVGIISIWANHEASKGYTISIVNESGNTFVGARFQLFYVSNDEATRIVIKASTIVDNFLYSNDENHVKKQISHITLKLASQNLTDNIIIESRMEDREFVINISPSIMESLDFRHDMSLAVKQSVARIWLWNGPQNLINGIVEYIMINHLGGLDNMSSPEGNQLVPSTTNSKVVADFLNFCERRRPGFIRRLNQAMKDGWDDEKLDAALGLPAYHLCTIYESLRYNVSSA